MRKGTLANAIDAVSTMDIVEGFDIPYRIKNGKTYILCPNPSHDDRHFGSCYIDRKDNGYYCYACSEHASKWQLVLYLNGNKKADAADWFFKTAGMIPIKENQEDPFKKATKVIRKIEDYLKNSVVYNDLKSCEKIESSYGRNINGQYLYSELSITNPLADIYKMDKQFFKDYVSNLLTAKIEKIEKTKAEYQRTGDCLFVDNADLITTDEIVDACNEKVTNIQALINEISEL